MRAKNVPLFFVQIINIVRVHMYSSLTTPEFVVESWAEWPQTNSTDTSSSDRGEFEACECILEFVIIELLFQLFLICVERPGTGLLRIEKLNNYKFNINKLITYLYNVNV